MILFELPTYIDFVENQLS